MGKKNKNKIVDNDDINNNNNKENDNDSNINEAAVEKKKKKNDGGGGDAGDDKNSSITVVLKVDNLHCEGCASKIVKCVRSFEGVETVKADMASNTITVVGSVDPVKIRDKLDQKTKKKIELVSPQPKKDNKDKGPKQENKPKDKPAAADDKKPKEAPVTTAVLKMGLHCQGCIGKILKIVSKTKGVVEVSVDKQKDLVTVKGTMDAMALAETLKEKLRRTVEIVPPKKEKENKESNGGDNNNNGKNGNGGKKNKGGGGGGGGGEGGAEGGDVKMEGNRIEYLPPMGIPPPGYGFQVHGGGGYDYGYPFGGYYQQQPYQVGGIHHAPQMFSDENPNACAVM